jgi:hypothetical protein
MKFGMKRCIKNNFVDNCWWLTPVILATWEAELRRIKVQGQSRQIIQETPLSKKSRAKLA